MVGRPTSGQRPVGSPGDGDGTRGGDGGWLGRVLLAAGLVAAVGYVAARLRARARGGGPERRREGRSIGTAADQDRSRAPAGEAGGAAGGDEKGGRGERGGDGGGDGDRMERLDVEAVEERAVEGADEVPAQPGEMEVEEELADEATDEDIEATPPDDETPGPDPDAGG